MMRTTPGCTVDRADAGVAGQVRGDTTAAR
jgi:hypothetical protein